MTEDNIILTTAQAQERLGLKQSAFKKYVKILEDEGFPIDRNDRNHRYYTSHSIMALEKLIELSKYDGMTLEKAARLIVGRSNRIAPYDGITAENNKSHSLLEELIQSNNGKMIEAFKQITLESEKRIIEATDKRFMNHIRTLQDEKKQAIEETASTKEKNWYDGILYFFNTLMNRRK